LSSRIAWNYEQVRRVLVWCGTSSAKPGKASSLATGRVQNTSDELPTWFLRLHSSPQWQRWAMRKRKGAAASEPLKKSAGAVNNESKSSHSGPGGAHSGTEHPVRHEAEAQLEEDPRPSTAEEAGGDSCAIESGAGTISVLPEPTDA